MLASMSATQFNEWMDFYLIEPWGFLIEERRAAQAPAILATVHKRKNAPAPKMRDFMLDTRTETEKAAAQIRMLEAQQHANDMIRRAEEMARTMRSNGSID